MRKAPVTAPFLFSPSCFRQTPRGTHRPELSHAKKRHVVLFFGLKLAPNFHLFKRIAQKSAGKTTPLAGRDVATRRHVRVTDP
jgi:hypothetical protein